MISVPAMLSVSLPGDRRRLDAEALADMLHAAQAATGSLAASTTALRRLRARVPPDGRDAVGPHRPSPSLPTITSVRYAAERVSGSAQGRRVRRSVVTTPKSVRAPSRAPRSLLASVSAATRDPVDLRPST